ncbi:uncharacterized protein LOC127123750 [Lathyrus oleraceus]|uniref:uncharacterized protein LOC127123750 n=1 Tax=Pisum sativum TaxID=3888 RepID=UPI0021D3D9B1|nr:uncharacterized protein LOC127123750 [Pisum sativum]
MEGMKDKIDQLTHTITSMMAREVEADKRKVASASTPPPVDVLQENYVNLSQQYEDENHSGMVQESKPAAHPAATIGETRAEDKYKTLEERLKVVKGFNIFGLDVMGMCLVSDVVISPKFKTPEFEKYKGVNLPKNHLRMFVRKMVAYAANEKLMMHSFQDSLSGESLDWYMQLEGAHIKTWEDLANSFLRQYKYNLDMALNRMQFQNLSQKGNKLFKEYAQRWRELASRVQPSLLESELVDMFTDTLQGLYYKNMIGSISTGFADFVIIGEIIENGLKRGKIKKSSSGQHNNKKYPNNSNSKKVDVNVVTIDGYSQGPYPYVATVNPNQYPQLAYFKHRDQQPISPPP